jgi:AraC family ethanolamine operon transcriptional activator
MTDDAYALLAAPKVYRFADIDAYRSSVRDLSVDFTPLVRTISAQQTILSLPGCEVNLTKSFPRISDAQLAPKCTAVGFTMDDGVPIRFNGVERDQSLITIAGGGAVYSAVEMTPRQYASIIFRPEVMNRNWPQPGSHFILVEVDPAIHLKLRNLVWRVISVASEIGGQPETVPVAMAIREALLAAIDTAIAETTPSKWIDQRDAVRQFKIFRDIEEALAGHVGDVIYSEALAHHIGVSVRTMRDAVQRHRGMSLHRYLRLRRLWLVRRRLIAGADSVKSAALAYGFWHLGDFGRAYREQFGEMPSETLARSR